MKSIEMKTATGNNNNGDKSGGTTTISARWCYFLSNALHLVTLTNEHSVNCVLIHVNRATELDVSVSLASMITTDMPKAIRHRIELSRAAYLIQNNGKKAISEYDPCSLTHRNGLECEVSAHGSLSLPTTCCCRACRLIDSFMV